MAGHYSELVAEFSHHVGLCRLHYTISKLAKSALLWQNFLDGAIDALRVDQRVCHLHEKLRALEAEDHASAVLVQSLVALRLQDCRELLKTVEKVQNRVQTLLDVCVESDSLGRHIDIVANHVEGHLD